MGLCLVLLTAHLAYDLLGPRLHAASRASHRDTARSLNTGADAKPSAPATPSTISLSESKFREAKIATEPARLERIVIEVGVTGLIQSNADRQVEIGPRTTGFCHARSTP